MNEDNIPKSRFKLSFSLNPRMTWPIGFVIWESGGKFDVSLMHGSTPGSSGYDLIAHIPCNCLNSPNRPH
jgi:hypothetical protein